MHSDTSSLWCRCCCSLNHPALPGYVEDAPVGISDFILSNYQQGFLSKEHPELVASVQSAVNSDAVFAPILGIYVMGSFGSISQTSASDLDIWICHQDDLSEQDQQRLAEKNEENQLMGIHISCGNAFLFNDAKTLP